MPPPPHPRPYHTIITMKKHKLAVFFEVLSDTSDAGEVFGVALGDWAREVQVCATVEVLFII